MYLLRAKTEESVGLNSTYVVFEVPLADGLRDAVENSRHLSGDSRQVLARQILEKGARNRVAVQH